MFSLFIMFNIGIMVIRVKIKLKMGHIKLLLFAIYYFGSHYSYGMPAGDSWITYTVRNKNQNINQLMNLMIIISKWFSAVKMEMSSFWAFFNTTHSAHTAYSGSALIFEIWKLSLKWIESKGYPCSNDLSAGEIVRWMQAKRGKFKWEKLPQTVWF